MPNGNHKNFVRLCVTIAGFRHLHGEWPTRVRVHPEMYEHMKRALFSEEVWQRLTAKIEIARIDQYSPVAEDAAGRTHTYGDAKADLDEPLEETRAWLGVTPDLCDNWP